MEIKEKRNTRSRRIEKLVKVQSCENKNLRETKTTNRNTYSCKVVDLESDKICTTERWLKRREEELEEEGFIQGLERTLVTLNLFKEL